LKVKNERISAYIWYSVILIIKLQYMKCLQFHSHSGWDIAVTIL